VFRGEVNLRYAYLIGATEVASGVGYDTCWQNQGKIKPKTTRGPHTEAKAVYNYYLASTTLQDGVVSLCFLGRPGEGRRGIEKNIITNTDLH
jgi:hypothetical protein